MTGGARDAEGKMKDEDGGGSWKEEGRDGRGGKRNNGWNRWKEVEGGKGEEWKEIGFERRKYVRLRGRIEVATDRMKLGRGNKRE